MRGFRLGVVRRPAGVVLLVRVTVPRGTVASLMAEIPRVAGVGVDTGNAVPNVCRSAAGVVVCTRGQEWCPMPAARWRITLAKRSGPAGVIRLDFAVGKPPGSS